MAYMKDGKIVNQRYKEQTERTKKKEQSIIGKSFYFLGPIALNRPLYIGYIIEDYGNKILVWIKRRDTKEETECTILKHIIKYDRQNDYIQERYDSSTNLSRSRIQNQKEQDVKSELKYVS